MPININILSPVDDAMKRSNKTSHRSQSDKPSSQQRPRTAISVSHQHQPNNASSSSFSNSQTFVRARSGSIDRLADMSLSLSPRQLRCPACMLKFHSEFARDEHYCRSGSTKQASNANQSSSATRRFSASTATTIRSPLTNQPDALANDIADFNVSISHIPSSSSRDTYDTSNNHQDYSSTQPSVGSHSEQVYYRKLADLNAECQRLQAQRDQLLEAHQQHNAQQAEQWSTHLNTFKDRVNELERKLRNKEESWQSERSKLMEKIDATYRSNKQQREDIVRLIDQHENHRRLIDSWKREKLAFEDELLSLKRISREQEIEASRQLDAAKHRHVELEREVAHWQSVAQLAEDSVVAARQQLEAAQSERRKREAAMREELVRVLNEMKSKEQDWMKERSDAAQQLAHVKKQFEKKLGESEKMIAVVQINEQQAKTEVMNLQADIGRMNDTMKQTIQKHNAECESLQNEALKQAKQSTREIERLTNKLADANTDKSRVESMLEQMIVKMESLLNEKAEVEMRADADRKNAQREIDRLMTKNANALDDVNQTHREAERAWNEDKAAMQNRLNADRQERQSLMRKFEEMRMRAEEERLAKEEAVKSLQDAEQVMRSWREEREREEEIRRRDQQDRRDRKEREARHKQELADIRRQARQESIDRLTLDPTLMETESRSRVEHQRSGVENTDSWNIEITPLEQDGWDTEAQLNELNETSRFDRLFESSRSQARPTTAGGTRITVSQSPRPRAEESKRQDEYHGRHSNTLDVDLEIDELNGYISRRHLSLSPGHSVKVQASDVDEVNIMM